MLNKMLVIPSEGLGTKSIGRVEGSGAYNGKLDKYFIFQVPRLTRSNYEDSKDRDRSGWQ